jgi:hypothetical protein
MHINNSSSSAYSVTQVLNQQATRAHHEPAEDVNKKVNQSKEDQAVENRKQSEPADEKKTESADAKRSGNDSRELSTEEQQQVEELKKRDQEVRAHEAAHQAAAGRHAVGGASYSYQRGPDGANYAVGGEVKIDASPVRGDPEASLEKAQTVRRAALAPAEPSAQDRAVAAQASKHVVDAQTEIRAEQAEQVQAANAPENGAESADSGTESPATAEATAAAPATSPQTSEKAGDSGDKKDDGEEATGVQAEAGHRNDKTETYRQVSGITTTSNDPILDLIA